MPARENLIGKKFGRLTVIELSPVQKNNNTYWRCQCNCGNIKDIKSTNLKSGITKSCGCYKREQTKKTKTKDLTNQKFGYLTALYINQELTNTKTGVSWVCQCDCGNVVNVLSNNLVKGNTKSCGCVKFSMGEKNIENILIQNNIKYFREYKFQDLGLYRFDFYLPDQNRLIEFDGIQHFKSSHWYETLEAIQTRDQVKNNYAESHNIPLVRIPYWERDNISLDLILGDKYLLK